MPAYLTSHVGGRRPIRHDLNASLKRGLENLEYGNALYVFEKDWERLSQLSRTELVRRRDTSEYSSWECRRTHRSSEWPSCGKGPAVADAKFGELRMRAEARQPSTSQPDRICDLPSGY